MRSVIVGIDPGLANTGWGVIETQGSRLRCLAYGCVTTDSGCSLSGRLASIYDELSAVVKRYSPSESAVESVYFGANTKSAFATGQARGVAILALAKSGVAVGEYSPTQIKHAVVGEGAADKCQVAYMVKEILELDTAPSPDHAADALAVAICHLNIYRSLAYGQVAI